MPTRSPDVLGLITGRIDHMESNLATQLHDVKNDLGKRIDELSGRVSVQNGRVGTLEKCMAKMEAEVEADLNKPMDKRKVALIGGSGLVGGAALLELLRIIGDSLHKAGYLG